jgi:hypothetical protein
MRPLIDAPLPDSGRDTENKRVEKLTLTTLTLIP